ncbi:hypothetical protein BAT02nite_34820 [Bacillus atrophaeus]|nr:hypothetical protein BAT02nite_34820 [Bacillus atrophaeus]
MKFGKNITLFPVNERGNLFIIENDYFRWGNRNEKSLIVIIHADNWFSAYGMQPIKRCFS